jgi:cytochrome c oxidase cbb3-type subunit 3
MRLHLLLLCGGFLLPSACPAGSPAADATDAALVQGRAIYNARCYFCHGYNGDGKTLAATFLSPPPAGFVLREPTELTPARIRTALRAGIPGTGMMSFAQTLSEEQLEAVARYIHEHFVIAKAPNTRYHTAENGWPDHDRYRAAFPFATGEIAVSRSGGSMPPQQAEGRRVYISACVTCHERGTPWTEPVIFDGRRLPHP